MCGVIRRERVTIGTRVRVAGVRRDEARSIDVSFIDQVQRVGEGDGDVMCTVRWSLSPVFTFDDGIVSMKAILVSSSSPITSSVVEASAVLVLIPVLESNTRTVITYVTFPTSDPTVTNTLALALDDNNEDNISTPTQADLNGLTCLQPHSYDNTPVPIPLGPSSKS